MLTLLVFLISPSAWSGVYPALKSELRLPSITVQDEEDRVLMLPSALESPVREPLFLLPVFTRCQMSCPVMVQALKRALDQFHRQGSGTERVILFSFDEKDTAADLKNFRIKQQVPTSWKIVRSGDAKATRSFFDQYSYPIMSSDGGFNHSNQIFVLNGDLDWCASLYGTDLSAEDIQNALQTIQSRSRGKILRWLSQSEHWVIIGMAGLLGSWMGLLMYLYRRRMSLVN